MLYKMIIKNYRVFIKFVLMMIVTILLQMMKLNSTAAAAVIPKNYEYNIDDIDYGYKENYELIREHLNIMTSVLNKNMNPCENFTEYACGNYRKDMYGIGIYPNIATKEYIEIAFGDRIADHMELFGAANKAKKFYNSCKNKRTVKDNLQKFLQSQHNDDDNNYYGSNNGGDGHGENITNTISSWPIFEKDWKNQYSYLWIKIIKYLSLLEISSVLEFNYNKIDDIIEISYGKDLSEDIIDSENDLNEMKNILNDQFQINHIDIETITNEIRKFTKERYLKFNFYSTNCIHCPHKESYDLEMDLMTLKNNYRQIDWDKFLMIIFDRKYQDFQVIRIQNHLKTLQNIEFIIELNDNKRILTNYLIWKLLKKLIKMDLIDDNNGDCSLKTFNKFNTVILALYSKIFFNEFNRKKYLEIYKLFKESYELNKCNYNLTNFINNHLNELIFKQDIDYIKNLDDTFSINKINDDYKLVKIINENNYYENLINICNHKICTYELNNKQYIKNINLMVFIFEISSSYNKPIYYSFIDKYFKLWEILIQNAISKGWNSNRLERYKLCLKFQSDNYYLKNKDNENYDNINIIDHKINSKQLIILSLTLKQAYMDYKKWLIDNENEKREKIFNEYQLNGRKIFFINYMQAHCNQEDKFNQIVQQSLLNTDEFSKEFKCSVNDLMNPQFKCRI